ncbi:hypothetical protein A2422_02950 [Candidatus Woesebacteria bacterium RIFOXYC1_FULL_31_51]|nr:MAG: hypothetical protein UR17_C0001G0095 [Candidatus Woesebacteria bacterium GW2011_GWF1_31_35]KKP23409.1 MAG: hypothetical protein UR11_C0001G0383 [Candidatus Woesebacteria bacterium GW2011_GWC1_30_29]KKP25067.1 MAG: hypothetical protein UR13_C0013G0013 [Candidatus Woesebacteria bacterium GW2011_GWD1_31_12]KKP27685.1 MAG: hypothetical protein UR16_C0002G0015 [Candidatus Woesebacteria bacterium GW2011_GWB1_31_29]KKP34275.1 MAG: hypothetical protein UR24_C0001G0340 [Candidatus Woesebacteria 
MIENNKNIPPVETGNLLVMIREATKSDLIIANWDEYDKSFNDFTNGFKASGHLVFGYLDGNNEFYPANSNKDIFYSYDLTKSIKIISCNPQPIIQKFKIEGYDKNTGKIIFETNNTSNN